MVSTGRHPETKDLRRFDSLEELTEAQLSLLSKSLLIQIAPQGKRVLELGATEPYSFLLLSGKIELEAADGYKLIIEAGTDKANRPIAQLRPRKYSVTALSPIEYLEVDNLLLQELTSGSRYSRKDPGVTLSYVTDDEEDSEHRMLAQMQEDLENDRLVLPSLPEVAVRIGRALDDDSTDAKRIAELVQTDPVITAKLIKTANSALFSGREPVDTCTEAVVRLGFNTTHKLVVSFALRELFRSKSAMLKKRMRDLWHHSTEVAAIGFTLSRLTRQFTPEHVMLAGLMHDIGVVAILSYAEKYADILDNEDTLNGLINRFRGEIGAKILSQWDFPDDFVVTAREAEEWHRDPAPRADTCDLVIIAQLHSYVGKAQSPPLPKLGEVPCFKKLDVGELTPEMSLKILEEASDQLAHAEALFRA